MIGCLAGGSVVGGLGADYGAVVVCYCSLISDYSATLLRFVVFVCWLFGWFYGCICLV